MSVIAAATRFVERAPVPDGLSTLGVAALIDRASRSLSSRSGISEVEFVRQMHQFPVALHVQPPTGSIMSYPRAHARAGAKILLLPLSDWRGGAR
jgi:hypothetical protein